MKLSATLSLFTLMSIAAADKTFGLVTVNSGSSFQFQNVVTNSNGDLGLGSSNSDTFTLEDGGFLVATNGNAVGIIDGGVVSGTSAQHTVSKDFGLDGSDLTYKGKQTFRACPNSDKSGYLISVDDCTGGTGVVLRATSVSDVPTPDFHAQASSAPAPAAPKFDSAKPFGIETIHSGSKFQFSSVNKVDSHPHVFSVASDQGKSVIFTLQKDGSLKDQDGTAVYVDPSTGEVGSVGLQEKASTGFSVSDSDLAYKGNSTFFVCPSGVNEYSLSKNDCEGSTFVVLHVNQPVSN